ncbi:MAG: hypothetical protein B7Y39_05425 [Bdellovibrio sp. 28-41-41]|nr:MAG: hypothetical protein B7Y39_05425 [Bdellovibrio sp. 28-41-41]
MKCNTAVWDRCLRFVVGVLLVTYAVAGGPSWMYLGIYFIITSAWGLCPVYLFFNIRTLSSKSVVKRF